MFATSPATALTLRDHQSDSLTAIREREAAGKRRLLVKMETGLGQTVVLGALAAQETESHVPILAHRDELIEQAVEKILRFDPRLPVGVVQGARNGVGWLLGAGDYTFVLRTTEEADTAQLWVYSRDGTKSKALGQPEPLDCAMGRAGGLAIAAKDAPWRQRTASKKQLELLARYRIQVPNGLTAGSPPCCTVGCA